MAHKFLFFVSYIFMYLYIQMLNYCVSARREHLRRAIQHCFRIDVMVPFFFICSVITMCRSVLDNPENQGIRELLSRSRRKFRSEDENEDNNSKKLKLEAVANTVTATNTTTTTDTKVEQGPAVLETESNLK